MTKTIRFETNAVGAPDANSKQDEADNKVHYGHAHARTEQLYQERRAKYELKKQREAAEARREQKAEKPEEVQPIEASASEAAPEETFGKERVKELALDAVKSVIGAAREAVHGRPLVGARKLAGDAVSGALRVAREVASRTSSPDKAH